MSAKIKEYKREIEQNNYYRVKVKTVSMFGLD